MRIIKIYESERLIVVLAKSHSSPGEVCCLLGQIGLIINNNSSISTNMTFNLSSDEDSGTNHFFINQLKWIGIFILVWIGISFVIPFPFSLPVIIGIFLLIGYYIRKRALKRQKNIHKETAQDSIDPAQNKWMILEPMPSERSGIAAASPVNSTIIYVFGGEEPSKTFNNNEKYDSKTGKWMSEPPLPTARHGLGAAPYKDRIYVIGGGPQPGLSVSNVSEIFHTR